MTLGAIKIFVGCDPNNCDLEQMMVLDYSIHKHTEHPVEIHWMQLSHDTASPWYSEPNKGLGWHTEKWATPFSGFRWAIPEYCQFKGRAIYTDADVMFLCDVAELWQHPIEQSAIVAAKGGRSTARLCTSVWDCEKAQAYLPPLVEMQRDPLSHKKLMALIKDQPLLVQPYTSSYNCIDGEGLAIEDIKVLHYSDMGTQFSHKFSFPRLASANQQHWFDGDVMPHPRQDLQALFDRYYTEALAAGYQLDDYRIKPFGLFKKASQANYHGNQITRSKGWLARLLTRIKSKQKGFALDD